MYAKSTAAKSSEHSSHWNSGNSGLDEGSITVADPTSILKPTEEESLQVMAPTEVTRIQGGAVAVPGAAPQYRDITDLLNLPQSEAAKILKIPTSTLSKRWKEAVRNRKWPYRSINKLDKEIMTLLHNIPPRDVDGTSVTPPEIELALGLLLRKRQEELKSVRIRL